MATNTKQISPIDIPFKEFMPGQIIVSTQFNDDMKDIEDKSNEIIYEYNKLSTEFSNHTDDFNNPHGVSAEQVGTYNSTTIDNFINDLKSGKFNPNSITNVVLADDCVETRNYKDGSITVPKFDSAVGSQLDISANPSIVDRYTKTETDKIIKDKVGDGTYSKEEIDGKFEEVQAGQIVDATIGVEKLKTDVGEKLNISKNPSLKGLASEQYVKNSLTPYAPLDVNNKQFLLKGYTDNYVGVPREVSVDLNKKTLRVHDGTPEGVKYLLNNDDYANLRKYIDDEILKLSNNLGGSHNHDDRYSGLDHTHAEYYKELPGESVTTTVNENGYPGLVADGSKDSWLRTTKNGIIPYQSGGASSIGSSAWRFNAGYFKNVNSESITTSKISVKGGILDFDDAPGKINFHNNDMMYFNDDTNEYIFEADESKAKSRLCTGSLEVNGRRIYVGSSFPSDARVNDILIQV